MKKVFALLLLISVIRTYAQNNLPSASMPPAYEIKSDTGLYQSFGSEYVLVIADKNNQWSIDEILRTEFLPITRQTSKNIGQTNWLWYKFRLKNKMPVDATFCLSTGADQSDFYIIRNGVKDGHYITGNIVQWSKKPGFKRANAIPVTFKPGEEVTVYQKRYNRYTDTLIYGPHFKISIFSMRRLVLSELKDYETGYVKLGDVYISVLTGIILLAAILNFLLFIETKDKSQLYFSLFLFFCFFGASPIFLQLLPREHFRLFEFSNSISDLAIPFLMLFLRQYFEVFKFYPRWDKILIAIILSASCFSIMEALFPQSITKLAGNNFPTYVFLLMTVTLLTTVIMCLRKGGEKRRTFIRAIWPLIFSLVAITVQNLSIYLSFAWMPPQMASVLQSDFMLYLLLLSIIWATLIFSSFLYRQYGRQEKRILEDQFEKERMIRLKEQERNELIAQQKVDLEKEVTDRTAELKQSLETLRSAQNQLIQSEKMASLGELTAGIAHEIQNPLNFVNNFSEVSAELVDEMDEELDKGDIAEAKAIGADLKQNLEKIRHHGKRADSIVKGMLEHSRSASGQKEPTDINQLTDEYLRLSYHGLRAKDKNFNAELVTYFDQKQPKISVIGQDIGRVLLNLFNNAFYAVNQKKKMLNGDYKPEVTVTTLTENDQLIIKVKDNGVGIPDTIKEKIMQPFFTTKPTGEGTGLGLSLSYDMIVKGHGGKIEVDTKIGEYTEFVISLPLS
jgi:two-component system, NtrC family, sensor kinase